MKILHSLCTAVMLLALSGPAPAKTPKATLAQHIAMFNSALAAPEVQSKLTAQGYGLIGVCGEAFGAHIRRRFDNYASVIKDANIKAD